MGPHWCRRLRIYKLQPYTWKLYHTCSVYLHFLLAHIATRNINKVDSIYNREVGVLWKTVSLELDLPAKEISASPLRTLELVAGTWSVARSPLLESAEPSAQHRGRRS